MREVYNEIKKREDIRAEWEKKKWRYFRFSVTGRTALIAEILKVKHFKCWCGRESLEGKLVADPFVIAKVKMI